MMTKQGAQTGKYGSRIEMRNVPCNNAESVLLTVTLVTQLLKRSKRPVPESVFNGKEKNSKSI